LPVSRRTQINSKLLDMMSTSAIPRYRAPTQNIRRTSSQTPPPSSGALCRKFEVLDSESGDVVRDQLNRDAALDHAAALDLSAIRITGEVRQVGNMRTAMPASS
jgi:hypothetical protein